MSSLIGQRLGQYEIIGSLGEGGMATVYRARQTNVEREVAIKVIKADLNETEGFTRRFDREAKTIASLSHPHILKLFDYGQQGDLNYLVMEIMTGGSLDRLLRAGALPLATVGRLLDQIAEALDYAHHEGVVHRDLKPQNVLLDRRQNAFLTDFGIAKLHNTTALTQLGTVMGTPLYMPPEQWSGDDLDGRADNYALGVMLYEMLVGQVPFSGNTPMTIMYHHLHDKPPSIRVSNPALPYGMDQVIEKALAKDRNERYQSAGDLAQAFKAALSAPASETPPSIASMPTFVAPPPVPPPSPALPSPNLSGTGAGFPVRRAPLGLIVGVVVALLVIAGGALVVLPKLGGTTTFPTLPATTASTVAAAVAATSVAPTDTVAPTQTPTVPPTASTVPTDTAAPASAIPATSTPMPATAIPVVAISATRVPPTVTPVPVTKAPTVLVAIVPTTVPTDTAAPASAIPATSTRVPPTVTRVLATTVPTNTATLTQTPTVPPSATTAPTVTAVPASAIPATSTRVPPTATQVPPTVLVAIAPTTVLRNTATPSQTPTVPPTATTVPTNTTTPSQIPTDSPTETTAPTETVTPTSPAHESGRPIVTSTTTPVPPTATPVIVTVVVPVTVTSLPATPTVASAPGTKTSIPVPTVTTNAQWTPQTQTFNGIEMVLVPPGCFVMGTNNALNVSFHERPTARICFTHAFWIGKTDITQAQFKQNSSVFRGPNNPVESINWIGANAFCAQIGARLPTEAEWEYVARGPDDLLYPWGNDWDASKAVSSYGTPISSTTNVGNILDNASWVGALDMSGNVRQWTSTIFKAYPYVANDGRENNADTVSPRTVRGGSWNDNQPEFLRSTYRLSNDPAKGNFQTGFRCVRDY